MTKAIIYTRFSPRRNAETSESCETQEGMCALHASQHNYEVAGVYHDKDVSGKDEYREVLWQAIEALGRGDILLVFKRDRLARNVYLAEQINRAVATRGATIEAIAGDVEGDSDEAVMIRQVLASIAEYERKMIGRRTSYAMRQHQRNGKRMGRYAPYGYRIDPADSTRLEPEPLEQVAVERIRELADEGKTAYAIAKIMTEEMPEAARARQWNVRTVDKIVERAQ